MDPTISIFQALEVDSNVYASTNSPSKWAIAILFSKTPKFFVSSRVSTTSTSMFSFTTPLSV